MLLKSARNGKVILIVFLGFIYSDRFTDTSFGYCCFSVSRYSKQIEIKIKTVQLTKSRIWEMKGGKYAKTLAKIQVREIDIGRTVLSKFIEICMETPRWCSSGWVPTWWMETNRNICYRVLLQKREFILRGTHKHYSNTFSITKPRTRLKRKFVWKLVFSCSNTS